jgi:putative two-component system response regulator
MVKDLSDELVLRLLPAAEHHDAETGNHIKRIGLYAEFLAGELGMGREFRELIRFSAPLHDIGKIGIPDHLLIKPGRLSREEWEVMKRHTVIGANILSGSSIKYIQAGHLIALHHHEKWDGSGYPFGLKGMEISIEGRIIASATSMTPWSAGAPTKKLYHEKAFP